MAGQQNIKQRGTHLPVVMLNVSVAWVPLERMCVCVRLRFPLPNVRCTLISQTRH